MQRLLESIGILFLSIIALFAVGAYLALGLKLTTSGTFEGLGFWLAWLFAPVSLLAGAKHYFEDK